MPQLNETTKVYADPRYKSQESSFVACYRIAEKCEWVSPVLKSRGQALGLKVPSIAHDDLVTQKEMTPVLEMWINDWIKEYHSAKETVSANILFIIRFHRQRATEILERDKPEDRYIDLIHAESPMHNWQSCLANLNMEEITLNEINYIHKVANAIKSGLI